MDLKKDDILELNQISPNDSNSDLAVIPTANATGRDAGNNTKLKIAAIGVGSLALILVGIGVSMGKYKENQEAEKAIAAEKAATEQKQMANGKVDIAKEQENIAQNNFRDLPPPVDATISNSPLNQSDTDNTVITTTPLPPTSTTIIEPQPYIPPTPKPRYKPEPILESKSFSSTSNVSTIPTPTVQPEQVVNNIVPDITLPTPIAKKNNKNISSAIPLIKNSKEIKESIDEEVMPSATISHYSPPTTIIKGSQSPVLVDVSAVKVASSLSLNNNNDNNNLNKNLKPTVTVDVKANNRGVNDMLLMRGTTIPCVLQTKIDSTYQGFTVCQISKDVYSSNGKTLLLERGSKVFGEQNIEIRHGQARVAVLWSRIETPKGVSVNIDSPATGQLGEMGIGAKVKNHFWKRFGASILLSMIQDGLAAATQHLEDKENGNNNTTVTNSSNTVETMAEKALNNTINIPPTAIVNQGTVINILVVRDVDFASVYQLKKK